MRQFTKTESQKARFQQDRKLCGKKRHKHDNDEGNGRKTREPTGQNQRPAKRLHNPHEISIEFRKRNANRFKSSCPAQFRIDKLLNSFRHEHYAHQEADQYGCGIQVCTQPLFHFALLLQTHTGMAPSKDGDFKFKVTC